MVTVCVPAVGLLPELFPGLLVGLLLLCLFPAPCLASLFCAVRLVMQAASQCPVLLQYTHKDFNAGHFPLDVVCLSNPHHLHLLLGLKGVVLLSRDPDLLWLLCLRRNFCCFLLKVFSSTVADPC